MVKINFKSIKKDWWLVNSILLFISAALIFAQAFVTGFIIAGLIVGGIDALAGVALLQRSKIIFWIVFITSAYNVLSFLIIAKTDLTPLYSFNFLIRAVILACLIMLWQQIRTESKKLKA